MPDARRSILTRFTVLAVLGFGSAVTRAETTVGSPFADHMVIQAERPIVVWGTDDAGQAVSVGFAGSEADATAAADGRWRVELPAIADPGPFELSVAGSTAVTVADVLVGDVWYCSGQSNMELTLRDTQEAEEAAGSERDERMRMLKVPRNASLTPVDDLDLAWAVAEPVTTIDRSAIAYWFGRRLREETGRPIGMIDNSWGATPIRAWLEDAGDPPATEARPGQPSTLFHGMTHALGPIAVRGVLWYQGENDARQPDSYSEAFPRLVASWRRQFRDDTLPVYFVQLSSWGREQGRFWPAFREMQRELAAPEGDGIDMIVSYDRGARLDIHPRRKRVVGERLALLALRDAYGRDGVVAHGPSPARATREGDGRVRVSFDSAAGLTTTDGTAPALFEVTDAGGKTHSVAAVTEGEAVVLSFDAAWEPVEVRYGQLAYAEPNLVNAAGLPAVPFVLGID